MAQFDKNRAKKRNNSKPTNDTSHGEAAPAMAALDEHRRQHLLLSSSSSSSSSSASSTSSASSSLSSDGVSRLSFVETHRLQCERGHFSGRFEQRATSNLEGRQISSSTTRRGSSSSRNKQHAMSSQSQSSSGQQNSGLAILELDLDVAPETTGTRGSSQLNRQHSDGSSIGAQLMNVLRIKDDLSSSGSSGLLSRTSNNNNNNNDNMLMTQAQQQQQQPQQQQQQQLQAQKLDTRLNSSGAAAAAPATTNLPYDQNQQVIVTRQAPQVMLTPVDQQQQHQHQDQYLSLANHHHQSYQNQYNHYSVVAAAGQLVPSAPAVFHHHHHQHGQHDQLHQLEPYQPSDSQYRPLISNDSELRYADLDEETTRHHREQQRQREEETSTRSLPESVVHVNEQVSAGQQQQPHAYYPLDHHHHHHHQHSQSHHSDNQHGRQHTYSVDTDRGTGDQSAAGGQMLGHRTNLDQSLGRDDSTTTLTALNSVVASKNDDEHHHHHSGLNSSMKQSSGTVSWGPNLTELSGASSSMSQRTGYNIEGGNSSAGRVRPHHDRSFDQSTSARHLTSSFASVHSNFDDENDEHHHHPHHHHHHHHHNPRQPSSINDLSSAGLDAAAQASHSSNDIDEELKVCEWRDCVNTYMDMNEFVRHLEEKHVNMEPHEKNRYFCLWHNCKRNKQEFNARYKLLIHMRVHSGEKPYSCQSPGCKKSFSRLENLKIHVRSHTGEKPYKCNYEHCSKSFTNSSDRIKHHKTHKDPKPYNCTQDGCTKRYTDPSSLRKHLRAHKRDGFGSMDSCESSSGVTNRRYSVATNSFSSQMDHTFAQSSSAASDHNHHDHHQNHHNHQHQQLEQQGQYPYMETVQPQQVSGDPYELQHQHQQQQPHHQQQEVTYLNADYDPSREFANVLFGSSNASEIAAANNSMPTEASVEDEASYYVDANFDRNPRLQQQQQQQEADLVDLDDHRDRIRAQPIQFGGGSSNLQFGGPRPVARFRSQMELHERHQQLSKSWCGSESGGSSLTGSMRGQALPWTEGLEANTGSSGSSFRRQLQQQPQMIFEHNDNNNNNQMAGSPSRMGRRVAFEFAPQPGQNYENNESWSSHQTIMSGQQQHEVHQQHHQASYTNQPLQNCAPNSGRRYGGQHDNWTLAQGAQTSGHPANNNNNQQRQIHHQQPGQQQHQHQNQLTRRRQHEQLMRSMPATVSFFQS